MGNSTGPRTRRGKARSSQNAAKHWIESGRILPDELKEAAILRSGFTEDFNPEGLIENEVVDDLTLNRLIKRRIDMAFTREFSKAAIEKKTELLDFGERSAAQYWLRCAGAIGTNRGEREKAERLRPDVCIMALKARRNAIGDRGPLPEDFDALRRIFGDHPTEHAAIAMYQLLLDAENEGLQDDKAEATRKTKDKKFLLDILQIEIESQVKRQEFADGIYAVECASDVQEPDRPALETLLRYRAANTREFKDLLDSLERIRHLRRSAA